MWVEKGVEPPAEAVAAAKGPPRTLSWASSASSSMADVANADAQKQCAGPHSRKRLSSPESDDRARSDLTMLAADELNTALIDPGATLDRQRDLSAGPWRGISRRGM